MPKTAFANCELVRVPSGKDLTLAMITFFCHQLESGRLIFLGQMSGDQAHDGSSTGGLYACCYSCSSPLAGRICNFDYAKRGPNFMIPPFTEI